VIKRGEYGAVLFHATITLSPPAICWRKFSIPPGRGTASREAHRLSGGQGVAAKDADVATLRRAVIYGSVMGSFCCEKFGVDRFRSLTREEIDARFREFQSCTQF